MIHDTLHLRFKRPYDQTSTESAQLVAYIDVKIGLMEPHGQDWSTISRSPNGEGGNIHPQKPCDREEHVISRRVVAEHDCIIRGKTDLD